MIKYHTGKEFDIRYDPLNHKYWLNKGDKLGEELDMVQIPSVTRIIDSCFPKHLTEWAAKSGADAFLDTWNHNLEVNERYDMILNAHKKIGEEAANIGSRVHHWLRLYIDEAQPEEFESPEGGEKCIDAFREWEKTHQVKWEEAERMVFFAPRASMRSVNGRRLTKLSGKLQSVLFFRQPMHCGMLVQRMHSQRLMDRSLLLTSRHPRRYINHITYRLQRMLLL